MAVPAPYAMVGGVVKQPPRYDGSRFRLFRDHHGHWRCGTHSEAASVWMGRIMAADPRAGDVWMTDAGLAFVVSVAAGSDGVVTVDMIGRRKKFKGTEQFCEYVKLHRCTAISGREQTHETLEPGDIYEDAERYKRTGRDRLYMSEIDGIAETRHREAMRFLMIRLNQLNGWSYDD